MTELSKQIAKFMEDGDNILNKKSKTSKNKKIIDSKENDSSNTIIKNKTKTKTKTKTNKDSNQTIIKSKKNKSKKNKSKKIKSKKIKSIKK